jgi:hypothetical protein
MAGRANDRQVGGNHYNVKKYIQQHWDYAWDHEYDQFQYCITKYVDRHKYREGLKDLRKAQHHLEKYIELLEIREKQEQAHKYRGVQLDDLEPGKLYGDCLVPREYVNPDL